MTVWLSDFDVSKMTSRVPYPYSEGDAEAFLAMADEHRFVIQRKSDGLFLGMAGLRALQDETGDTFSGDWSWVPYLIMFVALLFGAGLVWVARTARRAEKEYG